MPDWDCLGWARTEVMIFHVDGGGPQGNDVDVDDGASYGNGLDESTAAKKRNPHFCTKSQALPLQTGDASSPCPTFHCTVSISTFASLSITRVAVVVVVLCILA